RSRLLVCLGGTGHSGEVTGRMPNRVNYDLGFRGLVENQIGVRHRRHPADGWIVRPATNVGMLQQKVGPRQTASSGMAAIPMSGRAGTESGSRYPRTSRDSPI